MPHPSFDYKPDYHEAWYNKGVALGNLGRYQEAIDALTKLSLQADYHEAWYNKGVALVT
jgi:tetratricopeptide (TPR) repeat protein